MQIKEAQTIYMVGIKGVGMTALAEVLHGWGKQVTGSDTDERFQTDDILRRRGILVMSPFNIRNLYLPYTREEDQPHSSRPPLAPPLQGGDGGGYREVRRGLPDLIIYSTAYNEKNPEYAEAKRRGLAMLSYPEALGQLMNGKYGIAVAGSHGKTTTTALLGHVMTEAGLDPTVIVGSEVKNWKSNARVGKSDYVVIEADEYQNKFQYYNPKGLVITNIDWDHPDFFKTPEAYQKAFSTFRNKVQQSGGWVIESQKSKVPGRKATEDPRQSRDKSQKLPPSLLGIHNQLNTFCVHEAATRHLGISEQQFWSAVSTFQGTARRFDVKGVTKSGITVIDDYAHHPTEIQATLKVARGILVATRMPLAKLWVVFHPHTFTRTKALFADFAKSFGDADVVIVLDIYGSAREEHGGVHSRDLVSAITEVRPLESRGRTSDSIYIPTIPEAASYLRDHAEKNDVVITMGAGDVWRVGEALLR